MTFDYRFIPVPESMRCSDETPDPKCLTCEGVGTFREENHHNGNLDTWECKCWKSKYICDETWHNRETPEEIYLAAARRAQETYRLLVRLGVPEKDARAILPLSSVWVPDGYLKGKR